ncbi:MAG: Universal stress protein F [Phycisphaerae bacterium]|nr:Universal stress protein F [Phycisphaerae bacterium]
MQIELRNILYPTDFSELSLKALRYAVSFAKAYQARLHCLHVVDEAYHYWLSLGPEAVPVGPPMDSLMTTAEKQMQDFQKKYLADLQVPVVTSARLGRPFHEIECYAREQQIDLIVLATHGRSGITSALLGGTTEKVIRKAPCPVLTVREKEHDFVS